MVHHLHALAANYLRDIGLATRQPKPLAGAAIPYHLSDAFDLAVLELLDQPVVLAVDRHPPRAPAEIARHIAEIALRSGMPAVYACDALDAYPRRRLIEQRVPFLVPGNQLFIATLGIDLRERLRRAPVVGPQLSPSGQALFLCLLQASGDAIEVPVAGMAAAFGYSAMTASRAARELQAHGLVTLHKAPEGQRMRLALPRHEAWLRALPLLRSPVEQEIHVAPRRKGALRAGHRGLYIAGVSMLARHASLDADGPEMLACGRADWSRLAPTVEVRPYPERDTVPLQLWRHPPRARMPGHAIATPEADPLSVYLSLRDDGDPRVQTALDALMELAWQGDSGSSASGSPTTARSTS